MYHSALSSPRSNRDLVSMMDMMSQFTATNLEVKIFLLYDIFSNSINKEISLSTHLLHDLNCNSRGAGMALWWQRYHPTNVGQQGWCRGAGMLRWWEHPPPTNVAQVWFSDPASYVGWVFCWFSTLLWEVYLRVLQFSPLLKNQHFQIQSWNAQTFLNKFLWTPWCSVVKQITFFWAQV